MAVFFSEIILIHIFVLFALLFGSFVDLRIREVPDILSYGLVILGILIGILRSITYGDLSFIVYSLAGFVSCLIIGNLMYYTGQWGGGDAKILMGIGAMIGLNLFNFSLSESFLVLFLINIIIVGAVYGIFWVFLLSFKNWKEFKKAFEKARRTKLSIWLRFMFIVLFIAAIILVFSTSIPAIFKIAILIFIFFSYLLYYFGIYSSVVQKVCMVKSVNVIALTEGDWLSKDVKINGKVILEASKTGISLEDILKLKKNKIKEVIIKEGIPFVPSFLIAYVLTIIAGSWIIVAAL